MISKRLRFAFFSRNDSLFEGQTKNRLAGLLVVYYLRVNWVGPHSFDDHYDFNYISYFDLSIFWRKLSATDC